MLDNAQLHLFNLDFSHFFYFQRKIQRKNAQKFAIQITCRRIQSTHNATELQGYRLQQTITNTVTTSNVATQRKIIKNSTDKRKEIEKETTKKQIRWNGCVVL